MIISFFFRDYSRIIIHGDRRCVANQSSNPKTELTCVNRSPTPPPTPPRPQHHQKKTKTQRNKKQILEQSRGPIFLDQLPSNVLTKIKYNNNNNSNNNNDNNNNNSNNNNGNFICVLEYTIVNLATYRQFTNAA